MFGGQVWMHDLERKVKECSVCQAAQKPPCRVFSQLKTLVQKGDNRQHDEK